MTVEECAALLKLGMRAGCFERSDTEDEFEHISAEEKELSTTADVDMVEYDAKVIEHREQQDRDAMMVRAARENQGDDNPDVSTTSPMGAGEDPLR